MQPTFSSSRILLPVKGWFVVLTLIGALFLNFLPISAWPGMPDWVALVLVFWSVRESRRVGMGWGFVLGLAMDVADASLLGQHALAYVLVAHVSSSLSKRILWFPLLQQQLHVLPLLLLVQFVQIGVRLIAGASFPGFAYFVGPLIGAILWLPLTYALLLPQYQPVERDANRPI
ncbi:rod shape-determining protein MreD [Rhodocyclus tenuis]|uniref:Rod shape-determining protein MreD n=2 Tax=Rhodocyclus TaxID=1064 RepID=A0A6L5JYB6_RHOTE|nr:rod shape-determining protein MreD [Rhodocyclus gracilis]MQY51832.1 rod shape-determining protein MreD [Rhodocyclus gracilis]MRD73479.1 rod shape-determining protein MreD [Rhodocyclus gracilis]NJA88411.1 rod shape-determining protein MreD [Rhodocyclus gracilis]